MSLHEQLLIHTRKDLGSLQDERDVARAANIVANGGIIGCYNGGVCALWGDGRNPYFKDKMLAIKGADRVPLFGLTLPTAKFVDLIDSDKIPPQHRDLFTVPENLTLLSSLAFVRAPANEAMIEALDIPEHFWTRDEATGNLMIQNWGPEGSPAAEAFVEALGGYGVDLPGITSMNKTKTPEIVSKAKGRRFARKEDDIDYYLTDAQSKGNIRGSYTIVGIGVGSQPESITLIRDGNVPGVVLENLLDRDIVRTPDTAEPKFVPPYYPKKALSGDTPWMRRASLLRHLRHVNTRRLV